MKTKYLFISSILMLPFLTNAQCAMCKAVVESGDADMAESLNTGIVYLMMFPYILVAIAGYFIYKKYKQTK
ncbi:hypothetical protein MWU59_00360 [Flavobacteriaceae bacterium F08102]|nr:hypothetical protein [Flavobacteriaceae bacterium F08102]